MKRDGKGVPGRGNSTAKAWSQGKIEKAQDTENRWGGWSFPRSQSWLEGQSQILTQAKLLPAWGSPPLAGVGGSSLQQSEKTGDSLRSRGPGGGQEAGHRDMAKGRVGGLQPQILTKRSVLVRVGGRLDWVGLRIAPPPQRRPWGSPNPDIRVHLVVSRICGRHTRQKAVGGLPSSEASL